MNLNIKIEHNNDYESELSPIQKPNTIYSSEIGQLRRDIAHLYAKPLNTYGSSYINEQTSSVYNTSDQLIKSNSFLPGFSNFNSPSHLVPYQQSVLNMPSNSFNHSSNSLFNCPERLTLDDEYSGPITYEIFMRQQQLQQQKEITCCCNLYNNQTSYSSDSNETDDPINNIQEKHNTSETYSLLSLSPNLKYPLPSPIPPNETAEPISKPKQNRKLLYECTYPGCTQRFNKLAHFRSHERKHTGIKPYPCIWPECGWRFARSDELTRHFRKHTGAKPFSCTYCNRAFARSDHLAIHTKTHCTLKS